LSSSSGITRVHLRNFHKMNGRNWRASACWFMSIITISFVINISHSVGPSLPSTNISQKNIGGGGGGGGTEYLLSNYSTWIVSRPENSSAHLPFQGDIKRARVNTNTNMLHNDNQLGLGKLNKTYEEAGHAKVSTNNKYY